jgi:hypothetical protein
VRGIRFAGLIVTTLSASPAFAGLWDNIYQGLDYFVTPSGAPINLSGDGFQTNGQRSGRLRIMPNAAGQGYRLELDRVFGADSSGRPEVLDVGPYELELSGAVSSTLGFTTRFLPTGNADVGVSNLNYVLRGKSGVQDVTLRGTLNGGENLEVNPLGFYTLNLELDNTNSQIEMDGVIVDNSSSDTDFNIGPINIKGNIYYDMFVGLLSSVGVDTTGLSDLFPASPIDRISQEIQDAFAKQVDTLGARIQTDMISGAQDPQLAADTQRFMNDLVHAAGPNPPAGAGVGTVPEPASLALVGGAAVIFLLRRR